MTDQREDFEEAAARMGYNLTMAEHETGEYHYPVTQDAWNMWQECCDKAVRAQGDAEPVGDEVKAMMMHLAESVFRSATGRMAMPSDQVSALVADAMEGYTHPPAAKVPDETLTRLDHLLEGIENIRRNAGGDAYLWGYTNAMHKQLSEVITVLTRLTQQNQESD